MQEIVDWLKQREARGLMRSVILSLFGFVSAVTAAQSQPPTRDIPTLSETLQWLSGDSEQNQVITITISLSRAMVGIVARQLSRRPEYSQGMR
jgi:hypothetical protein